MIDLEEFYRALQTFLRKSPDPQQRAIIEKPPTDPIFIVAGPGTGKTTCLTLRILKLIFVDDIPPKGILATTFTRKAAAELRSRILGWGFGLLEELVKLRHLRSRRADLEALDINQVWTGTIDSLCEQLLRDYRAPGQLPPVLLDDFAAKTLLLREGLLNGARYHDPYLRAFLKQIRSWPPLSLPDITEVLQGIWERRFHDQIDWPAFASAGDGHKVVAEVLADYEEALKRRQMVDFALLVNEVLRRLKAGELDEFTKDLRVVLVDEYQDTNLLQERIYFGLAKACGGALTVVGDDDQSLFRFRGATVDLFSSFSARYQQEFGTALKPHFLTVNYRSTRNIIRFVNTYVALDQDYQHVRVAGKPPLSDQHTKIEGPPVLGMFRDTTERLARDLAQFIHRVFRGPGVTLPDGSLIRCHPENGDVGDCALICHTPKERDYEDRKRLPLLLREELRNLDPPIEVFNPRGEHLARIDLVALLGGLLLECLDPHGTVQNRTSGLSEGAIAAFDRWRHRATVFLNQPAAPDGLKSYVEGWRRRDPGRPGYVWPKEVAVLELLYGLTHYFEEFYDDPEAQVYLEVFTRQLGACAQVGSFRGRVIHDPGNQSLSEASIKELLRYFLEPIAVGATRVNEDLLETFPRDRLCILSIHQAKGLEFPLVIVDVGSDFRNRRVGRLRRFPSNGDEAHRLEDLMRPYSSGLSAPARSGRDRAFDDLYRLYFVAYSRPQNVLLLVGLTPTRPDRRVENVATGWDRRWTSHWASSRPFVLI